MKNTTTITTNQLSDLCTIMQCCVSSEEFAALPKEMRANLFQTFCELSNLPIASPSEPEEQKSSLSEQK